MGTAGKKVLSLGELLRVHSGYRITDNDNARARMNDCRDAIGASYSEVNEWLIHLTIPSQSNVRTALVNHPDGKAWLEYGLQCSAIAEVVAEREVRDQVLSLHLMQPLKPSNTWRTAISTV